MRKLVKALAIAAVISLVPTTAFAAMSTSSVRNSSSNHASGSSSVSGTVTPSTSTPTTSTTGTVVLANGTTIAVEDPASSNGTLTAGLVKSATASAAVGTAKRAGLPANVVAALDNVDAGSLAGISVVRGSIAGKTVLARTIAIRTAGGTQQQLVMDRSRIPASGVVSVLFYHNNNNTYTVEAATVDPATGIVTFTVPGDGTAAVIG